MPSLVMWYATTTAGSGHGCCSVMRFSLVCGGSFGMSRGTARSAFGTRPRYWVINCIACAESKSPTRAIVAFAGT